MLLSFEETSSEGPFLFHEGGGLAEFAQYHLKSTLLSTLALLSFSVNVLAFFSVALPALRGLFCCKHDCLRIAFTFSLLLLFECCFSPWWFKYLFCSGTHTGGGGGGGTLGISGWGCAARTLESLACTRASFSCILVPYTRVNSCFP